MYIYIYITLYHFFSCKKMGIYGNKLDLTGNPYESQDFYPSDWQFLSCLPRQKPRICPAAQVHHCYNNWWTSQWGRWISPSSNVVKTMMERCSIILSGGWFGTSIVLFPYIWNNHPNWLSYFSEGWPNHQPVVILFFLSMMSYNNIVMIINPCNMTIVMIINFNGTCYELELMKATSTRTSRSHEGAGHGSSWWRSGSHGPNGPRQLGPQMSTMEEVKRSKDNKCPKSFQIGGLVWLIMICP